MTELTINADQTVSSEWKGQKGRGSLYQLASDGNTKLVNVLEKDQLLAVIFSAKVAAFPLGSGEKIYRSILAKIQAEPDKFYTETAKKMSLGELRKGVVQLAGEGCNAPHDSYLKIAYDIQTGTTPIHSY